MNKFSIPNTPSKRGRRRVSFEKDPRGKISREEKVHFFHPIFFWASCDI
jgi:hypothetical protein